MYTGTSTAWRAARSTWSLPPTALLSLFFQDRAWEKFGLGERFGVKDPRTCAAARRNAFACREDGGVVPADASVEALHERGVLFLLCNNALNGLAGTLV